MQIRSWQATQMASEWDMRSKSATVQRTDEERERERANIFVMFHGENGLVVQHIWTAAEHGRKNCSSGESGQARDPAQFSDLGNMWTML